MVRLLSRRVHLFFRPLPSGGGDISSRGCHGGRSRWRRRPRLDAHDSIYQECRYRGRHGGGGDTHGGARLRRTGVGRSIGGGRQECFVESQLGDGRSAVGDDAIGQVVETVWLPLPSVGRRWIAAGGGAANQPADHAGPGASTGSPCRVGVGVDHRIADRRRAGCRPARTVSAKTCGEPAFLGFQASGSDIGAGAALDARKCLAWPGRARRLRRFIVCHRQFSAAEHSHDCHGYCSRRSRFALRLPARHHAEPQTLGSRLRALHKSDCPIRHDAHQPRVVVHWGLSQLARRLLRPPRRELRPRAGCGNTDAGRAPLSERLRNVRSVGQPLSQGRFRLAERVSGVSYTATRPDHRR